MIQDIRNHLNHYTVLALILLLGLVLFLYFVNNPALQLLILIGAASAYVFWGFAHHALTRDLSLPVMIEYVLVAILVTVVVQFTYLAR